MKVTQEHMDRLESLSDQIIEEGQMAENNPWANKQEKRLARMIAQLGRITKLQTELLRGTI